MKLLLKNIDEIYTNNHKQLDSSENTVIKNGYIIIEDHYINEVGIITDIEKNNNFDQIIDCKGRIALPGLVNTHTHAGMSLLRGYADDLPLHEWLNNKIWPYEASLSADEIYWGSLLSIMEMICTGTTTFADMYFQMEFVARAVEETGIRAILSEGLIEENDGMEGLYDSVNFCQNWHHEAEGRITTMLAPHAPYTCSNKYLNKVIEMAKSNKLPINIHVAESKKEFEESLQKHGKTPVKYLFDIGLFGQQVIAAHCVYLTDEDIKILSNNNTGISYNPSSNMKLGSGIAPIVKLLNNKVKVGLGTDGLASNNNLDLIEEARIGSYLQKVNNLDSTILGIDILLKMLTIEGAKTLFLSDVGKIKKGFKADIILIDINSDSTFYPHHNNLSNLFYAGNGKNVEKVIVNGQLIYNEYQFLTIDEEKVYDKVERIIEKKNV